MQSQRIIVKLGTSTLTNGTKQLHRERMLEIVQQIAHLHQQGHELILVSSGAQAAGREHLNFPTLTRSVPAKQMLSAVGQSHLMRIYSDLFDIFQIIVGQILLTRDDLSQRGRYLNARDTLQTMIEQGIIPIINENDTIATEEIRVGDNDNLSAMVASVIDADMLILLTDQSGLFTADPRKFADAQKIDVIERIDADLFNLAGGAGSSVGTGGMRTKLQAAQIASRAGVTTIIANGRTEKVIERLVAGEAIGTRLEAIATLESRKRWLLTDRTEGAVTVDKGAIRALIAKDGASLLPVGIKQVTGTFQRSATIAIHNLEGDIIAQGLSAYTSEELAQIKGRKSQEITDILGYSYGDAAIHRNNLVILDK
ncbi:MAG: glutamate 5-kinase [Phototrophicaceae bacterium]